MSKRKAPREPGLIDVPGKNELRPNRRDARSDAGPLKYVNPSMQIQNFGTAAGKAPASTTFTQGMPTPTHSTGDREATVQIGRPTTGTVNVVVRKTKLDAES